MHDDQNLIPSDNWQTQTRGSNDQECMSREYYEKLMANNGSDPVEIEESRFWEMLEVLPPCKWTRLRGSESFFISEAETMNLHTWLARIGGKYYELVAPSSLTHDEVLARICASLILGKR